jgi:Zn-dependent alcohol dehydrogenase
VSDIDSNLLQVGDVVILKPNILKAECSIGATTVSLLPGCTDIPFIQSSSALIKSPYNRLLLPTVKINIPNTVCEKEAIAIDISDSKLQVAKQLGADYIFNSSKENAYDQVMSLIKGGVDYCVESGGSVQTIELGFSLIKKGGGKLLFASHPPYGEKIKIDPHELISGKKISGSWGGHSNPDVDIPQIYSLLTKANSQINILITKRYKLQNINEALDDLDKGKVFRPLIAMEH